jgi:integrase
MTKSEAERIAGASEKPGSKKLDDKAVRSATLPASGAGAVTLWDGGADKIRGFGVKIYATGLKSFFVNYWLDSRERRITIGAFPTWSVAAARERAKELRRRIDQGEDPAGEKRERRDAPTIADLIERYKADHLPTKTAKGINRRRDEERMLAEIGRQLGGATKVRDVHSGDIEKMHRDITASGRPVRANRILTVCSTAFALALKSRAGENAPWRDAAKGNPCKGVARNQEVARERYYSEGELAAISDALASYSSNAADAVRLIMLTGCRPGEATHAQRQEFDAEPGFWIKPATTVKQRKTHKLPLNPAAIELVERLRKQRRAGTPWVFPGRPTSKPLASLFHVWEHVRKRAGLGLDATAYGLRHSFASIAAGGGVPLHVIGKLLGHTVARTTERYAHLADDPLRAASDKVGGVIAAAAAGRNPDNVVPLGKGRRP